MIVFEGIFSAKNVTIPQEIDYVKVKDLQLCLARLERIEADIVKVKERLQRMLEEERQRS